MGEPVHACMEGYELCARVLLADNTCIPIHLCTSFWMALTKYANQLWSFVSKFKCELSGLVNIF